MTAMSTISGRVVNGNGNGVADALVGIVGPSVKMVATADASGKFEQHMRPGRYSLSVTPPAGIKPPEPEPGSDQVRGWTPVYYPGVTLREAASKIVLHPGDQLAGIELKLLPAPAHVVRGILLNPDGTPAPEVTVALNIDEAGSRGNTRGPDEQERTTYEAGTNSEGAFEFPPVADGDWRIAAELERGGVKLRAHQWIEMAGHNIENVKHLAAPFSVQGRVVMEAQGDVTKDGAIAPEPPRLIPHAGRIGRESGAASWMLQPDTMARPRFRTILFIRTARSPRTQIETAVSASKASTRIAIGLRLYQPRLAIIWIRSPLARLMSRQRRCSFRLARFRSRSSIRPGVG